ncbi:MAG: YfcE family phosphodiesterase [Gemmatimonadetes bacterium]|nr:YfcE family phosphodiesterase [Gemmatimonadota bacterium]
MQIGIVSDTHDRVPASLHEALRDVDEIVHCGDICRDVALVELETIAPVAAVYGNCDAMALVERFPEELVLDRAGVTIAVIHGHRFPRGSTQHLAHHFRSLGPDLVLFGHSHIAISEVVDGMRFFNPGTAGGLGAQPSAGILTLANGSFEVAHVRL